MYSPKYMTIDKDIYQFCVDVAHAYHTLLKRQIVLEQELTLAQGSHSGTEEGRSALLRQEENEREIQAIEQAWDDAARDDVERTFIRLNLFQGILMKYIDLPMEIKSMKRCRRRFLEHLARNLHKI